MSDNNIIYLPLAMLEWSDAHLYQNAAWFIAIRNYVHASDQFENLKAFGHLLRFGLSDPTFVATIPPNFLDELTLLWKFLEQGNDKELDNRIMPPDTCWEEKEEE